jgi:hypothetical protein
MWAHFIQGRVFCSWMKGVFCCCEKMALSCTHTKVYQNIESISFQWMKKFIFRKYDSLAGYLFDYILAPYINCSVEQDTILPTC